MKAKWKPAKKAPAKRTALDAIARMPAKVRDEVSVAIEDGATWKRVAKICEAAGFPGVTAQNVTNYKKGDHAEWLRRRERMEAIRRDSETTAEIVRHYAKNGGSPAEAGLLAASEILARAVNGLGPEDLKMLLRENPRQFFAATRELARVAEAVHKRKPEETEADKPEEKKADPEEQRRLVLDMVDEAMGLKPKKK